MDLEALKRQQEALARRVRLEPLPHPPRTIGGVDVSYSRLLRRMVAVVAVFQWPEGSLVAEAFAVAPVTFPYIPTFLSFRELPAVQEALQKLPYLPDLLLVDGQGIAHPRRLGIAAHLGVLWNLRTLGIAKNRLVGEYQEPGPEAGSASPLFLNGEQVGWVVRTRTGVRPVFASPGHRISLEDTLRWTLATCRGYRLPEPIRYADQRSRKLVRELTQGSNHDHAQAPSVDGYDHRG